jgi:hypothetical protein
MGDKFKQLLYYSQAKTYYLQIPFAVETVSLTTTLNTRIGCVILPAGKSRCELCGNLSGWQESRMTRSSTEYYYSFAGEEYNTCAITFGNLSSLASGSRGTFAAHYHFQLFSAAFLGFL